MKREAAINKAFRLLQEVVDIKEAQGPRFSNQGQPLDGYAALYNYNAVADKIKHFMMEANKG